MLGVAAAVGVSPGALLRAEGLELELMLGVIRDAAAYQDQRDRALARQIVNEFAAALKRGKK